MYWLTVNLTSSEWMRIKQCADKQWPKEYLSHSEIARRYILVGIDELKSVSQGDQERLARQFQASMTASDTRLKSQRTIQSSPPTKVSPSYGVRVK